MSMLSRYQASMVLSGVGDAFAYKQGDWEFCHSGEAIYKEVTEMGGVEKIKVKCKIMEKIISLLVFP